MVNLIFYFLQIIFSQAVRTDLKQGDYNLTDNSFLGAMNLIYFSKNPVIGKKYLDIFIV